MRNRRNYYRLLRVQPDAPAEVIHASYHALMRGMKQHPDLGGSNEAASLLNEAHRVLTDPALRAEYDRELFAHYSRGEVPGPLPAPPAVAECPFCRTTLPEEPEPGRHCPTCGSPLRSAQAAELAELSRRAMARVRRHDRISYWSSWPQDPRHAVAIDLSPAGIRFECREDLACGAVLKVSGAGFEALAVVKYTSPLTGDARAVGAAFIAVEFENPRGSFLSTSV